MADLALKTANRIEVSDSLDQLTLQASVDVTAGQAVYADANGQWALADASVVGTSALVQIYVALKTVKALQAVTAVRVGEIDGVNVDALAYGAPIYLSDTAGALSSTPGTIVVILGWVLAAPAGAAVDKIIHLSAPVQAPYIANANQAAPVIANANGVIAALVISNPPTQAEVTALRDACETLADDVRAIASTQVAIRNALIAAGTIKGAA